jgi:PAS domain S-box-containing protein
MSTPQTPGAGRPLPELMLTRMTRRVDAESIIENAPDPIFVADLQGKILLANTAVSELLGLGPHELLEQSLSRFMSAKEKRDLTAAFRAVVDQAVMRNALLHLRNASGKVIPTTLNASALCDSAGIVIGAIGILRAMPELDKALAYAESLIKDAPDPVFVSDLQGKILQANDAASELLGFRQDQLLEQCLSRTITSEERREFTAALREVVERGVSRNVLLHLRSPSGEIIPSTLNASALRRPKGQVIGVIGVLRDVRAYLRLVRDLEESQSELTRKILDLEKLEESVVGRELRMIALEKRVENLKHEVGQLKVELGRA